jgi:AcrR family transcriptional regulator
MALRRDARRNRERIVAGARELFADDGVDVPVEEITRRAGVGMGTLYRHFATKEELVDAVLEDAFDAYVDLARRAADASDGWDGFAGFLEQALALHAANRGLMDVVLTSERGRDRAKEVRRRVAPLVAALVERAQAEGTLRPDLAAEDVPVMLWACARVAQATAEVSPDAWRRHLGLLLDGLRADAATPLPVPPLKAAQLARAG